MKKNDKIYVNRELSWLKFNERVLEEAENENTPLLERLKFISIFGTNLDEFFMVRYGSLFDQSEVHPETKENKCHMTADEQMKAICQALPDMLKRKDAAYFAIISALEGKGIKKINFDKISPADEKLVKKYFTEKVLPLLSPSVVDPRQSFPFLKNKGIYVGVQLKTRSGSVRYGFVPTYGNHLERICMLKINNISCFFPIEEIIYHFADIIFKNFTLVGKYIFSVTRNADIEADESYFDQDTDWREIMQDLLSRRTRLSPVRLQVNKPMSKKFMKFIKSNLSLKRRQIFTERAPLDVTFAFALADKFASSAPELVNEPIEPIHPVNVASDVPLIKQIENHDILLAFPFHSARTLVRLIEQAALDENVTSIRITLYRVATNSLILAALLKAVENGKDVCVLMELRARFDEQNNIDWSKQLERAGCRIIYGLDEYKVHSKLLIITRKCGDEIRYITHIGTGNYNEKTCELYTDISLITADERIGRDAFYVFSALETGETVFSSDVLMVAPNLLIPKLIELIDRETEKGSEGRIYIKCNSITDKTVIDKLLEASAAGVRIKLLVRGICCLKAGVPGESENITVKSIVGRYLEHSRVYVFGEGEDADVYISSADLMTRNTLHRVEVAAPIFDKDIKKTVLRMLDLCDSDNVKARIMLADGSYVPFKNGKDALDSQMEFFKMFAEEEKKNYTYADSENVNTSSETRDEERSENVPVISDSARKALEESLSELNAIDEEAENTEATEDSDTEEEAKECDAPDKKDEKTKEPNASPAPEAAEGEKKHSFLYRLFRKVFRHGK